MIREIRQKYDMVTYLLEYIDYPDQICCSHPTHQCFGICIFANYNLSLYVRWLLPPWVICIGSIRGSYCKIKF